MDAQQQHIGLSIEDFAARYYAGAWVISPETGKLCQVVDFSRETNNIVLSNEQQENHRCKFKLFTWDNVKIPSLGYRHVDDDGSMILFFSLKTGRITQKGMSGRTMNVTWIPEVTRIIERMYGMGLAQYEYISNKYRRVGIDWPAMKAIHNPRFLSLSDAVRTLRDNKQSMGFALHSDVAVTLGENCNYVLHYCGLAFATSDDGSTWTALRPALKEAVNNLIGDLKYA